MRRRRSVRALVAGVLVLVLAAAAGLAAQRGFRGFRTSWYEPNVPYDGRFTFARIRYLGQSGWEYDYPDMERNLMAMVGEITALKPHVRGSNIHTFDDPDLLRYPIAYLSEPGYWWMNEAEVAGLRTWIDKGGFLIVDDFMLGEWYNFEAQVHQAFPGAVIQPLTLEHPIFHSFFEISTLDMPYPNRPSLRAEFYGVYEDNDPSKRLIMVINYNNDIGDYMEWSLVNRWPVNITNEAYKFAINYLVYGLSH